MFSKMFRLWEKSARAPIRGLSCDEDGVFLGGHCALVTPEHDRDGKLLYRVRSLREINKALSAAYEFHVDFASRLNALRRAADYMTAGDWVMAQLTVLHLRVPDLPDETALQRLLKAERMINDGDFEEQHPRWPAGDEAGRGGQFRPRDDEEETVSQSEEVAANDLKSRCIEKCWRLLERPLPFPGSDRNRWDFQKCLNDCMEQGG